MHARGEMTYLLSGSSNIFGVLRYMSQPAYPLQVSLKLEARRNEALKWEVLRRGGSQEEIDSIADEVSAQQHGFTRIPECILEFVR